MTSPPLWMAVPCRRPLVLLFLLLLLIVSSEIGVEAKDGTASSTAATSTFSKSSSSYSSSSSSTERLLFQVDERWKSNKLTQKQKAELGLWPPPGEQWPEDDPELLAGGAAAAADHESTTTTDATQQQQQQQQGEDDETGKASVIDTSEEEEEINEMLQVDAADEEENSNSDSDKMVPADEAPEQPLSTTTTSTRSKDGDETKNRRKFVSYVPSKFEDTWVANIPKLEGGHLICNRLIDGKHQTQMMHKLLEFMCTAPLDGTDWCYWHDHNHFVWYNKANTHEFEIYIDQTPSALDGVDPPPVSPTIRPDTNEWDWIASKFTFLDEETGEEYHEYIEPLVGHLRFPLAGCIENQPLLQEFASFVIPPDTLERVNGRSIMFDVGSTDWSRMEYIVEEWEARHAGFAYLLAYSTSMDEVDDEFLKTIPQHHEANLFRQYFTLTDAPTTNEDEIYIPTEIALDTHPDDYVMLKLDRAPATLKLAIVQDILQNDVHVDELFWEINARGNYLFEHYFDTALKFDEVADLTLKDAYTLLQGLRSKGIRAHAWI